MIKLKCWPLVFAAHLFYINGKIWLDVNFFPIFEARKQLYHEQIFNICTTDDTGLGFLFVYELLETVQGNGGRNPFYREQNQCDN